jgi:uncharacterized membrane protein YdjX (TVP38/TMEM64 family)
MLLLSVIFDYGFGFLVIMGGTTKPQTLPYFIGHLFLHDQLESWLKKNTWRGFSHGGERWVATTSSIDKFLMFISISLCVFQLCCNHDQNQIMGHILVVLL